MNLLKSYLNSQIKIKKKINKKKRKPKKRRKIRFKSTKSVFVGKGDLKHNNDKVIITFFLYNAEKMYLKFLYNKRKKSLFYPNRNYKVKITETIEKKKVIKKNKLKIRKKKKVIVERSRKRNIYEMFSSHLLLKIYLRRVNLTIKELNKRMKSLNTILNEIKEFNAVLNDKDKSLVLQHLDKFKVKNIPKYQWYIVKWNMPWLYRWTSLKYYIRLLKYNKLKHKYFNLCRFIPFIENIYRKKVIFNIVNLKKRHLNSDIYTQIVSLKLRNRENKLYKVLRLSLRRIRVPLIKRIRIRNQEKKPDYSSIRNTLHNVLIQSHLDSNITNDNDFDLLFDKFFSNYKKSYYRRKRRSFSLRNIIISGIKHRKLRGIRVEAKGRLTRRRTAARSLFKMRYLGGLNNVISHIKGWSAIMLRGDQLSNVQYSIVNTNGRNGAFGIKGWVSSRTSGMI